MISRQQDSLLIAANGWTAEHRNDRLGGPERLAVGPLELLAGCRFFIDDMAAPAAVVERSRCSRKGGVAVHTASGYFPFGAQIRINQTFRYAACHCRATLDLQWPAGAKVRRHLGVIELRLPGGWSRFHCLPPAAHLMAGAKPGWQDIPAAPAAPLMIGHWHRPPLALVFEQPGGARLEVGCGDDIWRWEQSLGFGPESGSYKIFAAADGLRLSWEPLMCCAEFEPAPRPYRFTWYAAWHGATARPAVEPAWAATARKLKFTADGGLVLPAAPAKQALHLDLGAAVWPEEWRRAGSATDFARGRHAGGACLECPGVQKRLRRLIRQLRGLGGGRLLVSGLEPGPCWEPRHLQRQHPDGLAHWDMPALLDFASWARQSLGPDWEICCRPPATDAPPSFLQLFADNGFGHGHAEDGQEPEE